MKRKVFLLCMPLILLAGMLSFFLTSQHSKDRAHAASGTVIFQDNFDSYSPGPLPTGTGATEWTTVSTKGTGFGVSVTSTQANSSPNSLQVSLGSGYPGHAWAQKIYPAGTSYISHALAFNVYLDPSLNLNGQQIILAKAENSTHTDDGSAAVWLSGRLHLQVVRYDSKRGKHVMSAPTALVTGKWYSVELDQTNSPTNGSWTLFQDGTQVIGQTNVDTGGTVINSIVAGDSQTSSGSMAGSFYLDDVVASDISTVGSGGIFHDNFDEYNVGPLPTGTGSNQWTSVAANGTGFSVNVSNQEANSVPNSLAFTLGSTKGDAYAVARYPGEYVTHAAKFALYLSSDINLNAQSIALFSTENRSALTNGFAAVYLSANRYLQIAYYDSTGKKHTIASRMTVATGSWHTIELDQTINTTTGSLALYADGTMVAGATNIDAGSTYVNTIIAGDNVFSTNAMTGAFYIDDVVTNTQHIG